MKRGKMMRSVQEGFKAAFLWCRPESLRRHELAAKSRHVYIFVYYSLMPTDWDARWKELTSGIRERAFGEPGHSAGQAETYNRLMRDAEKQIVSERAEEMAARAESFETDEWTKVGGEAFEDEPDQSPIEFV